MSDDNKRFPEDHWLDPNDYVDLVHWVDPLDVGAEPAPPSGPRRRWQVVTTSPVSEVRFRIKTKTAKGR